VPAFANFPARMQLSAAFRALLLPPLPDRFLDLCFGDFRSAQPDESWFIGLLHRTLRVDAAG